MFAELSGPPPWLVEVRTGTCTCDLCFPAAVEQNKLEGVIEIFINLRTLTYGRLDLLKLARMILLALLLLPLLHFQTLLLLSKDLYFYNII